MAVFIQTGEKTYSLLRVLELSQIDIDRTIMLIFILIFN